MTRRHLEILQHALGVDQYGKGAFYRNHFCAGGDDVDTCRELVAMGFMKQHATTDWLPYFNCSVTDAGKAAMLAESPKPPKLTRSQKRYRAYLKWADAYQDTFRQYLTHLKEQRETEAWL